jgi:microcystin-dependent protein
MDPLLGQIALLPYNFAPQGWAPCTGQLLPIGPWQALFSLLETNYGGDGTTTFGLPNLAGKAPAPGLQYCIALTGVFPTRS